MNRYLALQKIVELGSFSKAAKAMGYTQSAMSQMITSLEQELSNRASILSSSPNMESMVFVYNKNT